VLRITFQTAADVVLLSLEGSVAGPWVEELRKAWLKSAKMTDGEPVNVDLGAVSFVDERGRDLLLRMRKEGVVLRGASSFLRYMLEDAGGNSEQSDSKKDRRSK
jgi:anti-anti-sigma regulatory factor